MQIFEVKKYCVAYRCDEWTDWSLVIRICACAKNNAFEKFDKSNTGLQFDIPKCCDEIPKIKECSKYGQKILERSKVKCLSGNDSKHYNNITFNKNHNHILANSPFRESVTLADGDNFCIGPTWNNDGEWKTLQVEMDLYVCPRPPCNNRTPCLRLSYFFLHLLFWYIRNLLLC